MTLGKHVGDSAAFLPQLLSDRPDLRSDFVLLERVSALDVGEPGCLPPTAVEDLTCRRDPVRVPRSWVGCDLQEDLGKEGGRTP